jgi:hypothetical protein
MDLALDKIALVVDKLAKASKTTDGIALTWTPEQPTRTSRSMCCRGRSRTSRSTGRTAGWR